MSIRPGRRNRMPATVGGAKAKPLKVFPTIGVCGLDCGLCPRYYTVGTSRCPGCGGPGFLDKHPSCSFITCCVKKRGLEVCGQCPEFPCPRFKSDEEYRQAPLSSSYPPDRKLLSNLRFIREKGIQAFARQQQKRMALLETMIAGYDDGRSRSFFCRAAALLDPEAVRRSLTEAKKATAACGTGTRDAADKARVLRGILAEAAVREGIELTATR
jgi:hypothetical protein